MKRVILILLMGVCAAVPVHAQTTDAMLDSLQHRAFGYFWYQANPVNGLIRDRSQVGSPCSVASTGFGLSAICVGVDRGWITRAQGASRVLTALQTLWYWPQGPGTSTIIGYKGLYYHFLDINTGYRTWTSELSTIDTALLFAGIIDAKQYFDGSDPDEVNIRALADSIYYRADWQWAQNTVLNPPDAGIEMGWKPEDNTGGANNGFQNFGLWQGYNEAMILYLLALGSPTHPVPSSAWTYWTLSYNWGKPYPATEYYLVFPPLFGHQYSHCWVDFRNNTDAYMLSKGISYFENSRRATKAQQAYAIVNPFAKVGYSDSLWGFTASDDPAVGYQAHGAPPAQNDNGTITPTAPLSSIPFAPDVCLPVAWNLWDNYRSTPLWGPYGFRDAFNLTVGTGGNTPPPWYDPDYIGIDEGPIVMMIENYRTGSIWHRFMQNADVQRGLDRAGFIPYGTTSASAPPNPNDVAFAIAPNPAGDHATLSFRLPAQARVSLAVYDLAGREVARLADGVLEAGPHSVALDGRRMPAGVYLARLENGEASWVRRFALVR